jgi:hypothetical protein
VLVKGDMNSERPLVSTATSPYLQVGVKAPGTANTTTCRNHSWLALGTTKPGGVEVAESSQLINKLLPTFFPAVSSSVVMSWMPEASMCFSVAEGTCDQEQACRDKQA